jgi:3D-(3,5/4)-trihydroxycyclohexane-1,2-dione acylhydrolase (decyclizing)
MNSEIVTAIAEGIPLTVIVVDNHGFQSIHGLQRSVGTPSFGNELRFRDAASERLSGSYVPIDFVKHAEAMGAHSVFAPSAGALRDALTEAKRRGGVNVVVVPVDPERRVGGYEGWWDVPVAEVSEEESVQQARAVYLDHRRHERVFV